jgi:hypothetical protein
MESYEVVRDTAKKLIKKVEDENPGSAEFQRVDFSSTMAQLEGQMEEMDTNFAEYATYLKMTGTPFDKLSKFDFKRERVEFMELLMLLRCWPLLVSVNTAVSSTPAPMLSSSPLVKLSKIALTKFSGEYIDYPRWKSQFETIVVPNRTKAEVALYLKEAIPNKYVIF